MDGLSLHINKAILDGQFQALHMGNDINISHSFFMDDVLIMGMLNCFAWMTLFHVFTKFSNAIGLHMNLQKFIFYHNICDMEMIYFIKSIFWIDVEPMMSSMKYLGYHIKPSIYRIVDWQWLVDHFYKRIPEWEFRCLSLGGRIIVTQTVLT